MIFGLVGSPTKIGDIEGFCFECFKTLWPVCIIIVFFFWVEISKLSLSFFLAESNTIGPRLIQFGNEKIKKIKGIRIDNGVLVYVVSWDKWNDPQLAVEKNWACCIHIIYKMDHIISCFFFFLLYFSDNIARTEGRIY